MQLHDAGTRALHVERFGMANTYTELYYHLIWATKDRQPYITPEVEEHLYGYIRHKCAELGLFVHAVNGMPDHVHLVCGIPPALSIAEVLERVKGGSSHFINHLNQDEPLQLYWQEGYGALTFTRRDLPRIVTYVQQQKQHHATGKVSRAMERANAE